MYRCTLEVAFVTALAGMFSGGVAAQEHAGLVVDSLVFPESAEYPLTHILQVVPDAHGGAFALDRNLRGVLYFGPEGSPARLLGREGSGPGEFQRPWRLTFAKDTIWVVDTGLDRLTGLDPRTGRSVDVVNGSDHWRALPQAYGADLALLGMWKEGHILVAIQSPESEFVRLVSVPRRRPLEAFDVAELDYADKQISVELAVGGPPLLLPNPFSQSDLLALDSRGEMIGIVRGRAMDQGPYIEVELIDPISRVVQRRRVQQKRLPATASDLETWLSNTTFPQSIAARGLFPTVPSAERAIRDAIELPTYLPSIRNRPSGVLERTALVSSDGDLWVELWQSESPIRQWARISGGRVDATLVLGANEWLMEVRGSHVWVQRFDELQIPTLIRREINWPDER